MNINIDNLIFFLNKNGELFYSTEPDKIEEIIYQELGLTRVDAQRLAKSLFKFGCQFQVIGKFQS